ncbi:MAG: DNA sulfur modification protein DndD [Pseudomonadales bacterium]
MILDKIALCDFRSYGGYHEIDLTPRTRYGAERPIVLFGGLNGAGKTTLLLAIKLALYGRQALGVGTTKADYESFIDGCIHQSNLALVKPNSAYVEIEFTYGKLGQRLQYRVRRSWVKDGKVTRESVKIWDDKEELGDLTQEECQGFLNELIPVGVSELFFFDGEKIAELAEDSSGNALGDAIRRLLGLDVVEKLRNDLRVYALRRETRRADQTSAEAIETAQSEFDHLKSQVEHERATLDEKRKALQDLRYKKDQAESRLVENGGHWGETRQNQQARVSELTDNLKRQQKDLRELLAGAYPLSLATNVLGEAVKELATELENENQQQVSTALESFAKKLKKNLDESGRKLVDSTLKKTKKVKPNKSLLLDITSREHAALEYLIDKELPTISKQVRASNERVANIEQDLDTISLQIQRAPDEQTLADEFAKLSELNERIAELTADVAVRSRDLKLTYHHTIEMARNLRRLHENLSDKRASEQPIDYAIKARALLKDFAQVNAERKVTQLETEFADAFCRLARKEDVLVRAEIDPQSFAVKLIGANGEVIDKTQLSAGEKQIYAIAMLEALARTSGRKLPVIIDTPLGRLDSRHRTNLVEHYFPRASHQVVLLSTDTEVDEPFYKSLSPNISHVYEIQFDEDEKASTLREGYFWRQAAYKEAI